MKPLHGANCLTKPPVYDPLVGSNYHPWWNFLLMPYQPNQGEMIGQDTTLCQTISLWGTQRLFPVHVQRDACCPPNETSTENIWQYTMLQEAESYSTSGVKAKSESLMAPCEYQVYPSMQPDDQMISPSLKTCKHSESLFSFQARQVSAGKLVASCGCWKWCQWSSTPDHRGLPSYRTHLVTPVPLKLTFRANGISQVTGL